MKIKREEFLNDLLMVKAGLSPREFIEQSSCFVFQDGQVMTFNDEVACCKTTCINVTGAVQATSLLDILDKLDDPELSVRHNEKGELEFRGVSKGFGVTMDAEIFLPIIRVDEPQKWHKMPPQFVEAVRLVQTCVSTDESKFRLTCIHIHPEYLEACDNLQVLRCYIKLGVRGSVLIRGASITHILDLGMSEIALTASWIHFRNPKGLVFSCRRYNEEYPSLDGVLEVKGQAVVLPKGLGDACDRATVFASDKAGDPLVCVSLNSERLKLVGEGLTGWYKEFKKVVYNGPPLEFAIAPSLLKRICDTYSEAVINENRLKVTGDEAPSWEYVTVLGKAVQAKTNEEAA